MYCVSFKYAHSPAWSFHHFLNLKRSKHATLYCFPFLIHSLLYLFAVNTKIDTFQPFDTLIVFSIDQFLNFSIFHWLRKRKILDNVINLPLNRLFFVHILLFLDHLIKLFKIGHLYLDKYGNKHTYLSWRSFSSLIMFSMLLFSLIIFFHTPFTHITCYLRFLLIYWIVS